MFRTKNTLLVAIGPGVFKIFNKIGLRGETFGTSKWNPSAVGAPIPCRLGKLAAMAATLTGWNRWIEGQDLNLNRLEFSNLEDKCHAMSCEGFVCNWRTENFAVEKFVVGRFGK
jgi:hypothetical protein